LNAAHKTLDYGDFVPAKKKPSQKIDETQGSFVRVNPNVTKLSIDGDKITIISKLSPKKPVVQEQSEEKEAELDALAAETVVAEPEPAEPDTDISVLDEIDSLDEKMASGSDDFVLQEPGDLILHRTDEIKRFLADDRRSLKLEKRAVRLLRKYEDKDRIEDERAARVKQPIGIKLVVIISLLLIVAVGGVTYVVSYFVSQDARSNAEENNLAINSRTASDTENRINSAVSSVTMFLDLMTTAVTDENSSKEVEKLFFDRNREIVAVYYSKFDDGLLFASNKFLVTHELEKENVLLYMQQESESGDKAKNGSFEILNATPFFNVPLISMFCPASSSSGEGFVAFLYSTAGIGESFASGSVNQSFFVNNDGIVLVHSDLDKMNSSADLSSLKIVEEMLSSPVGNGQIPYTDENGDEYIGAFRKLGIGNGGVNPSQSIFLLSRILRKYMMYFHDFC